MTPTLSAAAGRAPAPSVFDTSWLGYAIAHRAEEIWRGVIDQPLEFSARRKKLRAVPGRQWAGCVSLSTGAWSGALSLRCSERFAREAAASMLGEDPSAVSVQAMEDAIGELTILLAEQVAASAGGSLSLGLAVIVKGTHFATAVPQSRPLIALHAHTNTHPITITVVAAARRRETRRPMRRAA